MDFSWALSALKAGRMVTCKDWRNRRFLWLKPAVRVEAAWCHDPVLKELAEQAGGIAATSTISTCFKDPGGAWMISTGWVPQQEDLFAENWMEYPVDEKMYEGVPLDGDIAKLPKAGGMKNCEKLSKAINQLLDEVTNMPSLNAYVELGPNDKELTIIIREEGPTADSVPVHVHVGCTFHITRHNLGGCSASNPDDITKSSIGSPVKNTKPVAGGYEMEDMQSNLGKED